MLRPDSAAGTTTPMSPLKRSSAGLLRATISGRPAYHRSLAATPRRRSTSALKPATPNRPSRCAQSTCSCCRASTAARASPRWASSHTPRACATTSATSSSKADVFG
ncbi:MAG: hypothetical protein ACK55Z_27270, partial [bacterium]